jgi:hypothetical protein
MATTYYASWKKETGTAAVIAAKQLAVYTASQAVSEPYGSDITVPFVFNTACLTTPYLFVVNDVVKLVKIPKGAVITDWFLSMADVDSGSSSTTGLGLVNAGAAVLLAASTIGQGGGNLASVSGVAGSLPYGEINTAVATQSDGGDVLLLTASAAGAGAGPGTNDATNLISGWVRYIMRPHYFTSDSSNNA